MKDMRAVRFNEKIKRLSYLVSSGGLVLWIAGSGRNDVEPLTKIARSGTHGAIVL